MTGRVLLALAIAACSSSGYGPDDPGDGDELDVSGTWTVTAMLIEEDCPEDVEPVNTGTIQIEQDGTEITFRQGLIVASGTINLQTGQFVINGSVDLVDGVALIMEEGRFTSDTRYTSETSFTIQPVADPSCTIRTSDTGVRQ
ncbi:MAG: hypothetical protein ACREK7_10735 [Gemmatimonadota bacterium]